MVGRRSAISLLDETTQTCRRGSGVDVPFPLDPPYGFAWLPTIVVV